MEVKKYNPFVVKPNPKPKPKPLPKATTKPEPKTKLGANGLTLENKKEIRYYSC